MNKILPLCLFLFSTLSWSQVSIHAQYLEEELSRAPDEVWIWVDCIGPVKPKYVYPIVEQKIMRMHFQVNPLARMPSMLQLRENEEAKFRYLTKTCTEKRQARVDQSYLYTVWLDWDTDWEYTHLEIGESIIADHNSCRAHDGPCQNSSQCCGSTNQCDVHTNTCIDYALISEDFMQNTQAE